MVNREGINRKKETDMKAVVYFNQSDVDKARNVMGKLKADGVKAHWAGVEEFQDPRDVEIVDEVHLVSDAPHIERAYATRKIKVVKVGEAKQRRETKQTSKPDQRLFSKPKPNDDLEGAD